MKTKITLLSLLYAVVNYSEAQTGSIEGKVINSVNNQAVPFSSIAVQGTTYAAISDINGDYKISGMVPGDYNVSATSVGYEGLTQYEIEVHADKPTQLDFRLVEKPENLKTIEVRSEAFNKKEETPISIQTIGVAEISRNPGGNRDISRVIQSLPGVAPTPNYRNDIIIRGGSPNENRFYIDGIELPNINHFATQGASGGPVGMINVDLLRNVDFYASAFPADRGNALSSVMEFYYKDGRKDKTGGSLTVGASDFGFVLEGPANKNASYIFSARRSYLQFLFKMIGLPFLPTYNDFQTKYKWTLGNKDEISFVGLGAIDNSVLNTELQKNGTQQQKYILGYLPEYYQWNYVAGLKYVHYRQKSYSTFILSRNTLDNRSKKFRDNINDVSNKILDYNSVETENKFRFENTSRNNGFKIVYGIGLESARYTNSTYNILPSSNIQDTVNYSSTLDILKAGAFFQISKTILNDNLSLSFGIRTDANNFDKAMSNPANQISPRFSLSYQMTPKLSASFTSGIYYQLPPYTALGYRDNTGLLVNHSNNLTYIDSKHFVVGFEYITEKNLKISLEGFLKLIHHYPFIVSDSISLANLGSDYGVIGNTEVTSTSSGRSYGVELMLQQKLFKGLYGLITYTYVRSEFLDKNDKWVYSAWDNIQIINFTVGKTFKKNLEIGVKWRFSMGAPYTPYNISLSSEITNWNIYHQGIPDYSLLNTKRLPVNHELDIRVDKKLYYKKFSFDIYLDIQNLYNFKYTFPPILDVVRDTNNSILIDPTDAGKYQTTLLNNRSGNILPTIGVIFDF